MYQKRQKRRAVENANADYVSKMIDKFKGKRGEDVETWVQDFLDASKGLSSKHRLVQFRKALDGDAKEWYKRQAGCDRREGKEPSLRRWIRRLKEEYRVEPHMLEKMEADYKQRLGQPAREYVSRKLELIGMAHQGYDDERKVRRLFDGVNKNYKKQLQPHIAGIIHSKGVNKIRWFQETLEDVMRAYDDDYDGHDVFIAAEDGMDGVAGIAADQAVDQVTQAMAVMQTTFPSGNPFPQNNRYQKQTVAPNECFGCRSTDHRYDVCPMNSRNRRLTNNQPAAAQFQQPPQNLPPPQFAYPPYTPYYQPYFPAPPPPFPQFQPPPAPPTALALQAPQAGPTAGRQQQQGNGRPSN